MVELVAIAIYFSFILLVCLLSYSKNLDSADFIIGKRSLNYWLTALAAHASDMSSWLFMAYPAMIFMFGLKKIWIAVGLTACMFCNWQFIAKKIRIITEQFNCLTFFSYLEHRFQDNSGALRISTAIICFIFYTIYISAGLVGLGLLMESLFQISFHHAIMISSLIVLPYLLIGGYKTLAWLDLFQGLFLMLIIVLVPCILMGKIGGWEAIVQSANAQQIKLSILSSMHPKEIAETLLTMLGWGLGYFGQPTIITKFMGIKDVQSISKSKLVGMSWMIISLVAATFVGLIGIAFFNGSLQNSEMVFVKLVQQSFNPFIVGIILCAVFAASINVMCSQILVLCSSFTEDIYKRIIRTNASSKELLTVSRLGVIFVLFISFMIAYYQISSIYSLVLYAWSGLGATFGPLLIFSLYSKRLTKLGAWSAILSGSLSSALWPWFNAKLSWNIDPIIIGFSLSSILIATVSYFSKVESQLLSPSSPPADLE